MRYVRMAGVSSQDELKCLAEEGRAKVELIEVLYALAGAERNGFKTERKRFDAVEDGVVTEVGAKDRVLPEPETDYAGGVFVYKAPPLWAAVEVGEDGQTLTLLKIFDAFSGNATEQADLLADAHDRQKRGERI